MGKKGRKNQRVASNKKKGSPGRGKASGNNETSEYLTGQVPHFGKRTGQSTPGSYRTLYSRYKSATSRFLSYMRQNTPVTIAGDEGSVNFLLAAADWMAESDHVIEPSVMNDLRLCIRIRSRVAKAVFGGGDAGHKHFLNVLVYCWTVLRLLPQVDKEEVAEVEVEGDKGNRNRFAALELDEVEGDDEEEIFPTHPVPRPVLVDDSITFEKLLASDVRHDAVMFLFALDDLMSMVSHQYGTLAKNVQAFRQQGIPESAIVENLLEAAVVSNFAIQQVQQLEMELQAQHDHLSTPYRLLASFVMPAISARVATIAKNHGSKKCAEHTIVAFVGDCIECYFRNPSDRANMKDKIVRDFCSRHKVAGAGRTELDQLFLELQPLVGFEVPILERSNLAHLIANSHSWLPANKMKFIGGDRAIHHTLRLLQTFGGVVSSTPKDRKIESKPGCFGPTPWVAGRSTKIHGDLDELFMSDLLPSWSMMSRNGILGHVQFPFENELCPLFVQLRSFIEAPDKPVTWSLAFGVHAMLTGILEVDGELNDIIKTSKATFSTFFRQVKWAGEQAEKEKGIAQFKAWKHNIGMVCFLESFGMDVFNERAIWNPVCSGTILSILAFFANVEAGCAVIDGHAQLRITLYLYHGLLINGILKEGDVSLLDSLYGAFKNSKAVWEGALPAKGELVKRFWICHGSNLKEAKKLAESAKLFVQDNNSSQSGMKSSTRGRKMNPIDPASISAAYRRVQNRDFDDVCDRHHTPEQRKNSCSSASGSELYTFVVRTNDTLDAMDDEQVLLSTNLVSCAYILDKFCSKLCDALGWEQLLKSSSETKDRQAVAMVFGQTLLGALDFSEDPLNHNLLGCPLGLASSTFMKKFFQAVPSALFKWFHSFPPGSIKSVSQTHNM